MLNQSNARELTQIAKETGDLVFCGSLASHLQSDGDLDVDSRVYNA
jgi:hypothetical protein